MKKQNWTLKQHMTHNLQVKQYNYANWKHRSIRNMLRKFKFEKKHSHHFLILNF